MRGWEDMFVIIFRIWLRVIYTLFSIFPLYTLDMSYRESILGPGFGLAVNRLQVFPCFLRGLARFIKQTVMDGI